MGCRFWGVFLENCFVHDGAFLQFFFNNFETSRLEISLRFCSKHQKNVLDYFFIVCCVLGSIFGEVFVAVLDNFGKNTFLGVKIVAIWPI